MKEREIDRSRGIGLGWTIVRGNNSKRIIGRLRQGSRLMLKLRL
jgi:hypothetical protein